MTSPSIDIIWALAEAEAAHAGFPVIEPAHFWVGVCKAVDLELGELLNAAAPKWKVAEERIAADLGEVKEAMTAVGLSPVKLRRALRAELGRAPEVAGRPLHRSPALRTVFKQAAALAAADGGSLRPAHLLVALIESEDPVVSAAMTKLGQDSARVLRELGKSLRQKTPRQKTEDKRKKGRQPVAEVNEKPKKPSALERFGRDLTAGGWTFLSALPMGGEKDVA